MIINIITWLIAGAVTGWLATLIIRRRHSILLRNIVIGSVGGLLSGYLVAPMFHIKTLSFSLPGLMVAVVGTIVLLLVFNFLIFRQHTVTNKVLESHWSQIRDKIHVRWEKITEEDVNQINGNYDRFIHLIEERYAIAEKPAEDELQTYLRAVVSKVSWQNRAKDVNPEPGQIK